MKKNITIILVIASISAWGQKDTIGLNLPMKDGVVTYTGVVTISGKSKADLYKNAKQWFVDYFKSSNDVIQNQDKEEGTIIGKGIVWFNSKVGLGMNWTWYDKLTIRLECKDGRYRYSIYDMTIRAENSGVEYALESALGKLTGTGKFPWSKGVAKGVIQHNDERIKEVIASINNQMNKTIADF